MVAVLEGSSTPSSGADIVELGMVPEVAVDADGVVHVTVKLTIAGCPLRAQIKREIEQRVGIHPGVADVRIEWGEMTPDERTDVMLKARWNARAQVGDTQIPATTRILAIASGKGGVGKARSPSTWPSRWPARAARWACSTPTSGASPCPACSASASGWRRSAVEGRTAR